MKTNCAICREEIDYGENVGIGPDHVGYCERCEIERPDDVRRNKMGHYQYLHLCSGMVEIEPEVAKVTCSLCRYFDDCTIHVLKKDAVT